MKASKKWPDFLRRGSDEQEGLPIGSEDDYQEELDLDQMTLDDLRMPGRDPMEPRPEPEILTGRQSRRRLVPFALAGVAVVAVLAIVFVAYGWLTGPTADQNLPVVQAPDDPVKVKPESPGGMEVPYQEQLVLNQEGAAEGGEPVVERLLPPPEAPQWPPSEPEGLVPVGEAAAPESGAAESAVPEAMAEETTSTETQVAAEAVPGAATVVASEEPSAESAPATPVAEPSAELAAKTEREASAGAAAEPAATAAPASGSFMLQLVSLTKRDSAKAAWSQMQKKHSQLLGDLSMAIQQAEVGGKTYYRVQAGPFPNRATALDVCAQLKAKKQDCLVVRR
ncbi:MAG: SPOR domain-containing protein [Rhodospirillales bacterium]|nr:SPOR domain-containing protein [Rhodospirillales bacterium]